VGKNGYSVYMKSTISLLTVQELAAQLGLLVVSVTDCAPLAKDEAHLRAWQEGGFAGELSYMKRDPQLLSHPRRIMPAAQSVVVVGVPYDATRARALTIDEGRVARYAWGRDYHKVIRKKLELFVASVGKVCGGSVEHRVFSDSVPLLERGLAARAGLGFIGKNTMLIVPRAGSFLFLGEVLWALKVIDLPQASVLPPSAGCGSCSSCLDLCPSRALVSEKSLDARRCISYLTIEKRGNLETQERLWLGEWLFGCDVCQEVCPHNFVSLKKGRKSSLAELSAGAGVGEVLSLSEVLSIRSDEQFCKAFAGTALMRTKREGLVRNAAIVAANKHAEHLLPLLGQVAQEDSSGVIRRHALWAVATIAGREGGRANLALAERLVKAARADSDVGVRQESASVGGLLLQNSH
jgi:epoxyqueuosine reductase